MRTLPRAITTTSTYMPCEREIYGDLREIARSTAASSRERGPGKEGDQRPPVMARRTTSSIIARGTLTVETAEPPRPWLGPCDVNVKCTGVAPWWGSEPRTPNGVRSRGLSAEK